MSYLILVALLVLSGAIAATVIYVYRDLRGRLHRVCDVQARAGDSLTHLDVLLASMVEDVQEVVSAPVPLTQVLALTEAELRQWTLEQARKEDIERLTRLLDGAANRLPSARQTVHQAGAEWIEVAA